MRFIEDGTVSEIPILWLNVMDGSSQCWWPGPAIKNVSMLISKKTIPEKKTWLLCDVEIEKLCGEQIKFILSVFEFYFSTR